MSNVDLIRDYELVTTGHKIIKDKKRKIVYVNCSECGKDMEVVGDRWKKRKTDMCRNCYASKVCSQSPAHIKHGLSRHRLYAVWQNINARCHSSWSHNYKYYGAKGIDVCEMWKKSAPNGLLAFFSWSMCNGYKQGLQIDRIDNKKGYAPDNCQWITQIENLAKMENLFGVEGRKVKKHLTKDVTLKVSAPNDVENYKKLDNFDIKITIPSELFLNQTASQNPPLTLPELEDSIESNDLTHPEM